MLDEKSGIKKYQNVQTCIFENENPFVKIDNDKL